MAVDNTYAVSDRIFDRNRIPVVEPPNELISISTFLEQELHDTISIKEV